MESWLRTAFAALLFLGTASLARGEPRGDAAAFAPFVGAYRDLSLPESRATIERAIERATSTMGFVERTVARERLRDVNPPRATIRIAQHGAELTTEFDDLRYVGSIDGSPRDNVDRHGDQVRVFFWVEGLTLHARYTGKDGEKRYAFRRAPDGQTLDVQVTVSSKRLPAPVHYRLRYRRAT